MGKRKMHGYTYYQCDWTGFPMRATNCYMPVWTDDKMVKRGSYCNWESVLAHAQLLYDNNESSAPQLAHVQQYIHELTGMPEQNDVSGFGFSHLEHFRDDKAAKLHASGCAYVDKAEILFGNNWDSAMYHKVCCAVTAYHELTAVKITPSGVYEVLVGSKAGRFRFEEYVDRPYMTGTGLAIACAKDGVYETMQSFVCTHKPKMAKDREVSVFYWHGKNGLPKNDAASALFKMQIYGDVLLVQKTKEACFKERDRYVHFTEQNFNDYFTKKKKKPNDDEVPALTDSEFKQAREEMVSSLSEFEKRASVAAVPPGQLLGGATMPPSTGAELMEVAKHLGCVPPKLERQPTTGKRSREDYVEDHGVNYQEAPEYRDLRL